MNTRKGFTLVEILIVIIIVGILAAAILLSSGSATASAEATKIIHNLRDLKSACIQFRFDSKDTLESAGFDPDSVNISMLVRYVDDPSKLGITGGGQSIYKLEFENGTWWVGYDLNVAGRAPEVIGKLVGRAESIGLYNAARTAILNSNTETQVWMLVHD